MMKYAVFLVVIEVLTTSFLVSAIRLILVACPHVKTFNIIQCHYHSLQKIWLRILFTWCDNVSDSVHKNAHTARRQLLG